MVRLSTLQSEKFRTCASPPRYHMYLHSSDLVANALPLLVSARFSMFMWLRVGSWQHCHGGRNLLWVWYHQTKHDGKLLTYLTHTCSSLPCLYHIAPLWYATWYETWHHLLLPAFSYSRRRCSFTTKSESCLGKIGAPPHDDAAWQTVILSTYPLRKTNLLRYTAELWIICIGSR